MSSSIARQPDIFHPFKISIRSTLQRFLFFSVALLAVPICVVGQIGINEAHVLPSSDSTARLPKEHALRADVDLVMVNVTVLDHADRAITGLAASNFAVIDDKHPQVIKYVSSVDEPISWVVVLDASGSMAGNIQKARNAFADLVDTSNPLDDFGMIVVGDTPRIALQFGDSTDDIRRVTGPLEPNGATALWDGMVLGIEELKKAHHQRKAMVVISDGGDNHSRHSESELKALLKEADVQVYAIGIFNRYATRHEERVGPLQLDEVTSITGGRVFSVHDSTDLSRSVNQISLELRNQYVLGYYPSNRSRDGKWRKVKIHFMGPPPESKVRIYARKGYYGPAE
ncbi:MAG: VWA domain-containing protein [Acidobacteria bacterium]|nr:VWA domain-containing protein [Acidobacteriota bacterium]